MAKKKPAKTAERPKYINPLTDFGFKRIFGTEANRDLLIDFLNCILPLQAPIVELTYKNVEQIPNVDEDRKVIYDLFCKDTNEQEFIIEMQKGKLTYFRDRALFYLTFPIQLQAKTGKWNFKLSPVYYLALLDFFYEPEHSALLERDVHLKDQKNVIFYTKLFLKFIQLPAFNKPEAELKTRKDQWLYYLKNLENMQENLPKIFTQDAIFNKVLKVTEIAALSQDEYQNYQVSRMQYLEIHAALETAFDDGAAETEKKMRQEIEAERRQKEAAQRQKEEAERQKEEAQRQKEEAEHQKEEAQRQKEEATEKFLLQQQNIAKKQFAKGLSIEEIAELLEIEVSTVKNWLEL